MDRFQKVYSQGTIEVMEIWKDTETGVHYVFHRMGMLRVLLRCLIKMENRLWHCNLCRFYL